MGSNLPPEIAFMVFTAAEINLLLSYSNVSSQCLCGCVQTLPTAQAATRAHYWL